jgi:hypothetical protein
MVTLGNVGSDDFPEQATPSARNDHRTPYFLHQSGRNVVEQLRQPVVGHLTLWLHPGMAVTSRKWACPASDNTEFPFCPILARAIYLPARSADVWYKL